ncbi:hypothetical protein EJB05_11659, partial [Eragrostis curvula]
DSYRRRGVVEATAAAKKLVTTTRSKLFGTWTLEAAMLPLCMTLVQVFTMVTLLLSKLALNAGMHPFVFLVYRNLVAAAAVAPLAFIFERKMWGNLSLAIWSWISVNAVFGIVLALGLYYYGLRATSASYSVNFLNLIPIVTFVIAIVLRSEKLVLAKWPGKMKLLGTVVCVGGAMVVSMFKGRLLHLWSTNLLRYSQAASAESPNGLHHDMAIGTLFLCGSCLSYGLWFAVQARLAKVFPSKYLVTTLTCLLGSLQSIVIGIFLNHDISKWKIKWDLQLLTVVYSGVFNTAIPYVLNSWAISRRGPVYPTMFSSLLLIITTVMDSVLLGTNTYLGSAASQAGAAAAAPCRAAARAAFVSERTGAASLFLSRPGAAKLPEPLPAAEGSLFHDRPTVRDGRVYFVSAHEQQDRPFRSLAETECAGDSADYRRPVRVLVGKGKELQLTAAAQKQADIVQEARKQGGDGMA